MTWGITSFNSANDMAGAFAAFRFFVNGLTCGPLGSKSGIWTDISLRCAISGFFTGSQMETVRLASYEVELKISSVTKRLKSTSTADQMI